MKLTVEHLQKRFGDKQVLRDISYTFEQGRIYGLLGRNGAGKTTFLTASTRTLPCPADASSWRRTAHSVPRRRRMWGMYSPPRWCPNF